MQEILSHKEIEQKINRLAHQIIENCFDEKEIFIGGIIGNGNLLAERLAHVINKHSDLHVHIFQINLNKQEPWSEKIEMTAQKSDLKNGYIFLVDDVINSGKTMQYALIEILQFPTRAIKTVALVDRKHRRFPIKANFVGLSLSTTLKERVDIKLENDEFKAYLV